MTDYETTAIATLACFYFIPTIIALIRNHESGVAILVVNALLGWTLVGWVVALAWSVKAQQTKQR